MTDREKIIFQLSETYKVLEIVTPHFNQIMDYEGMIQGCKDALALLKEQDDEIAKFCGEVARLTAMLEEQKAEIRQLKLALDIVKGTRKGIGVEGQVKWE